MPPSVALQVNQDMEPPCNGTVEEWVPPVFLKPVFLKNGRYALSFLIREANGGGGSLALASETVGEAAGFGSDAAAMRLEECLAAGGCPLRLAPPAQSTSPKSHCDLGVERCESYRPQVALRLEGGKV